jgi:hypothetical protein
VKSVTAGTTRFLFDLIIFEALGYELPGGPVAQRFVNSSRESDDFVIYLL